MSTLNFTKHALEALPTPDEKRASYYDTKTRGLGLLIQPTGHRSFFWFRKVHGQPTWKTIGNFPELSVEQARTRAEEMNVKIADWKSRDHVGPNPLERPSQEPTLGEVLEHYADNHLAATAKNPDKATKGVRWMFGKYLSSFRNRRLGTIRRDHLIALHKRTLDESGGYTAGDVVALVRTLFYHAMDKDVRMWQGENPAAEINLKKLFHEQSRARFLQAPELILLASALALEPSADLRDFVLIALFTGARANDIMSMRFENVDFSHATWTIPDPKNRTPYVVPLIPDIVELLKSRRERNGQGLFVFPGRGKTKHITGFKRTWPKLLARANITGLRIHDLRRTLGSWQAAGGSSLLIIGASLGHKSEAATKIYSRLQLDPVRQSVTAATNAMITVMKGLPPKPPEK